VRQVLEPILRYIEIRQIPARGITGLRDAAAISAVLSELHRSGVVSSYAGGEEPVYAVEPGQHMVAAFYRNNAIHWFVSRAIVELAMLHAAQPGAGTPLDKGRAEARRLRDQLKFEFFFPERDTFEAELTGEMRLIAPDWDAHAGSAEQVRELLTRSGFLMAHRVLRSFVDAQLVVAERLAARSASDSVEPEGLLDECEAVGRQMLLQGRLHGPESLSRELFRTALQLAENRDLLEPGSEDLTARREQSASYVRDLVARIRTAESLDTSLRAGVSGVGR
jgi:glycerol-3-phosphate O-acyltransferase